MLRTLLLRCVSLGLLISSVSGIKTLRDIKDLKNLSKNFGREYPQHGLMLLHWFANSVKIDHNGVTQLHFDPTHGSFGSSCHRSEISDESGERKSSSGDSDARYYVLGDLAHASARKLPFYVMQDFHNSLGSEPKNADRLLVKVQKRSPRRVDKVYITQHFGDRNQGSDDDSHNTYEISTKVLLQIQALSKDVGCGADDPRLVFTPCDLLKHQKKVEKVQLLYAKTPGLAWFLTLAGYNIDGSVDVLSRSSFCSGNPARGPTCSPDANCWYPHSANDSDPQCYEHHKLKLEVKSTPKGYAKIIWSGLPEHVASMDVKIGLHKGGRDEEPLKEYPLMGRTYGFIDTGVPLNPGLQVRLLQSWTVAYYVVLRATYYTSVWKGPEFDEADVVLPTNIRGYHASLQLYTKDGYACARLYIKKSFSNWRNIFDYSWVGIYASSVDDSGKYKKYEWVVNFEKRREACPLDYDVYEYESSVPIGPGVQARFMLTKHSRSEKARTLAWEKGATVGE